MGTIANLAIRISAETAAFNKGLAEVDKNISKISGQITGMGTSVDDGMNKITSTAKHLAGALGLAFSVDALIGATEQVLHFGSTINDLSMKTGIGIQGLQELNYAAVGSGISIEDLGTGISQMSKRIALGDRSAVDALSRLGLSLGDLQHMAPDQVFYQIADAVLGIPNPMEQTAIMMELFGRSGAQYLPLIKDHLQEFREEAQRTGAVLSADLIQKADELDDAWGRAKIRGKALLSEVLIPMVDIMTSNATSRYSVAGMIGVGPVDNLEKLKKGATGPDLSGMLPAGLSPPMSASELDRAAKEIDEKIKKANAIREKYQSGVTAISDAIGGKDLIEKAHQWTEAVAAIGGGTHLTALKTQEYTNALIAAAQAMELNNQIAPTYWRVLMRSAQGAEAAAATGKVLGDQLAQAVGLGSPGLLEALGPASQLDHDRTLALLAANSPGAPAGANQAGQLGASSFGAQIAESLKGTFQQLPQVMMAAFQGGGSVSKSIGGMVGGNIIGGLAGKLTGGLSSMFGKTIGGALGSVIPGLGTMLGSMVGPLIGKVAGSIWHGLQSVFGKDEEARLVNPARDKRFGGTHLADTAKRLEAAGYGGDRAAALMSQLNAADTMAELNAANAAISSALAHPIKAASGTRNAAGERVTINIHAWDAVDAERGVRKSLPYLKRHLMLNTDELLTVARREVLA